MRPSLLYFHIGKSTFVMKDIELLSSTFDVKVFDFKVDKKALLPWQFTRQIFFLLRFGYKSKISVSQFGGYHTFLPVFIGKIIRTKSIIVLGGTDTVSFPSIKYGSFNNRLMRPFLKYSLKKANLLLPVSESLIETDYNYQPNDFPKQGYAYFIPSIKTPVKTIYNGYDSKLWFINDVKEPNSFVTVGVNFGSRFGLKLKGLDLILEIAPRFPKCKFYLVGGEAVNINLPSNIIKLPKVNSSELSQILSTKSFYLQLSISEGFPNGLCEGMLSGCIPICSNVGAMPFIVGELGYVLNEKSADQLEILMNKALGEISNEKQVAVRQRIAENFTLERRKDEFIKAVNSLIQR